MKQVNGAVLKKGDVILTTSPAFTSKVIRAKLKSDISHAMLYVAASSVMDSTAEGVQARNIQRMFYPDDCAIHVLRLREPASEDVIDAVISYVRSATGTAYSVREAIRSAKPSTKKGNQKQFCSRLVARAYASAGILLCPNPDFCSPEELRSSELLSPVEPSWIWASEEEAAANEAADSTKKMREATQHVLNAVRKFAPEVLSLQDVDTLALTRPQFDQRIAAAYSDSGYLDLWKLEIALHPTRYDLAEMLRFESENAATEAIREYCETTLRDEQAGDFNHWRDNLRATRVMHQQTGSETFRLLHLLYSNLVATLDQRVEVARAWLILRTPQSE